MRDITISIDEALISAVVKAHKAYLSGKDNNEFAAYEVIAEEIQSNLDIEHKITRAILDLPDIDLPYDRET